MSDSISIQSTTKRYRIDVPRAREIVRRVADALGLGDVDVSLMFVGDARIRTLNRDWRGKDRATDVLSFPQTEWPKPLIVASGARVRSSVPAVLGDIVISPDQAARNARGIGQGLDREVCFLIVHGMLHLCGHDHMKPAEERVMRREQAKLMERLGLGAERRRPLWQGCVKKVERRS